MPAYVDHLKGRLIPSDYRSKKQFNENVDEYIKSCRVLKRLPTKAGLPIFMGFVNKREFRLWIEENKEYESCLYRAHDLLEDSGIQRMTATDNKNGNGCHKYMSKAFNYNDKLDISADVTSKVIRLPAKVKPGSPIKQSTKKKKPVKKKKV